MKGETRKAHAHEAHHVCRPEHGPDLILSQLALTAGSAACQSSLDVPFRSSLSDVIALLAASKLVPYRAAPYQPDGRPEHSTRGSRRLQRMSGMDDSPSNRLLPQWDSPRLHPLSRRRLPRSSHNCINGGSPIAPPAAVPTQTTTG